MFDEIVKAHLELEDINDGIIKNQKEYIAQLENYVTKLENAIEEMKKIMDEMIDKFK